jgi:hypothetical protein
MAQIDYAFIKNNEVINVAVFEDSVTQETLEHFKNEFGVDILVIANEKTAIGGTFDGEKFWLPQPYSSWIKNNETNNWEAPTPYPADGRVYTWVEDDLNWQPIESEV